MERFADGLVAAFAGSSCVELTGRTVNVPTLARRVGLERSASHMARFIRYPVAAARLPADVYHVVDQAYADLAAFLPRARTVATCHDLMLLRAAEDGDVGFRGRRSTVFRYRWSTSFLSRIARVICVTETTRRDAVRLRGVAEGRTSVIPPGVDERFRPVDAKEEARAQFPKLSPWEHVVLHVSTGHPYKNAAQTLRVVAALRDAGLRTCLARVGRPLKPDERQLAQALRIDDALIELGLVSDEQLVHAYRAADVLLFPSYYEGFGLPPLEAMASGTPVVISQAPALLEVGGGAALAAPADDTRALTQAVRSVLEKADVRERLRERGLRRAQQFTWDRAREAYERVYIEVLSGAGRAPEVRPARFAETA